MAKKPHVRLNSNKQKEDSVKVYFNYGFGGNEDVKDDEPNYTPMIESFRSSLLYYNSDKKKRIEERNDELEIPYHIDYIKIQFLDQFNIEKFNQIYYNDFGLLAINFANYGRTVLFAIIDERKFNSNFLLDIENFIQKESGENDNAEYHGKIKFIKEFKLYKTIDILKYQKHEQLMNFQLAEFPINSKEAGEIYSALIDYIIENNCHYRFHEDSNLLEVFGLSNQLTEEIVKNFDIVISVTSSLATIVGPSELNIVERSYGFAISNENEDLPIIGILDTGISKDCPLSSILVQDDTFNLTSSSPFEDNANNGFGHGTSVAALAALGRKPYNVNYRGELSADAKLLSLKILDQNSGILSMYDVLDIVKRAKSKYPELKIFVLTTSYSYYKNTNEEFSIYATELDRFAFENDCLIFICTSNNNNSTNQPGYNLEYFREEETNLCTPAESMNNVIVGAAAGNLSNDQFAGISFGKEFPPLYSRKSHIDLSELFPENKQNKNLFRPDVIEYGGDYEQGPGMVGTNDAALMEVLSSDPTRSFHKDVGTSFSTPLVANVAAQILKKYPSLKAQTIKALVVNAASLDAIHLNSNQSDLLNKIAGHGLIDPEKSVNSNDNSITMIIEDEIAPEEMKIIPLNFPEYLSSGNLGKVMGIVKVSATLCFSFDPVANNQLAYCPINMAFSIFRNHRAEDILKSENEKEGGIKSKLKSSWSQNNRWKSKPIPASNTQKISFPVNIKDLKDENSTFKLAIHCLVNSQLLTKDRYNISHPFSLVINIEENLKKANLTGRMYQEVLLINEIENIINLDSDIELNI